MLFDALSMYETECRDKARNLPDLVCIISGRGPLRDYYCDLVLGNIHINDVTQILGRIKTLLLRQQNDYFGDAFGHASAAFWQAAAAASIESRIKKINQF